MLDDDRNFEPGRSLILSSPSGERNVHVEMFHRQHGRCILRLRGIDSIAEAEALVGLELRLRSGDVLPPRAGAFYTFQLKGCDVYDKDEYIGGVTDVLDTGGVEILKIELDGEETLIPFAQSYLRKINVPGRRIDMDLPEGLRDINK